MVSEKEREKWERAVYHVFSERRMTALALMILPLLFVELTVELTPEQVFAVEVADWVIWSLFVAEFLGKLYVAKNRAAHLINHPIDTVVDVVIVFSPIALLIPALVEFAPTAPLFRLLRDLRLERVLKAGAYTTRGAFGLKRLSAAFYEHKFYHYALFTAIATVVCSALIFRVEHGLNPYFADYWSALWWSLVTVLTVGGLAATPVTLSGRAVAGVLMLFGIGFVAVLTANIAAFFLEQHSHVEKDIPLHARVSMLLKRNKEIGEELEDLVGDLKKVEEHEGRK